MTIVNQLAINRNNMASVKRGRLLCRLLHGLLLLLQGVPIIGPGGIKRGLLPKVFDPHLQKHKVHRLPFNLFPLRCLQKKWFLEKTSIGVRGSFSLHGNHWYGSGMAVTVADITVSFRCRCANGDDCDDDLWPTYTECPP